MTKKVELTKEELEQVSGGDTYQNANDVRFLYGYGFHVEVHTYRIPHIHQFTSRGVIDKKGYIYKENKYWPCYYITCDDSGRSGWYLEDEIQDSTLGTWEVINTIQTPVTEVADEEYE